MKNNKLYIISNIIYTIITICFIYLYPNLKQAGYPGFLLIITYLLHCIITIYLFTIKDQKLNNNTLQNISTIIIYLYILLIIYKYKNNLTNQINIIYFKINYIIASISLLSITINKLIARTRN